MRSLMTLTMLALVVLLGIQYFKPGAKSTPPPATQNQAAPQKQAQNAPPQQEQLAPESQAKAAAGQKPLAAATPAITSTIETRTAIENAQYRIVFSNKGGRVVQWILKGYKDASGKPLDMVQPQAAGRFGYPLSFFTYDPALAAQLNQALYQVTVSGVQPTVTGYAEAPATNAITFHYAADGLDAVKTVRFDAGYVVTVETEVRRNGVPVRALVQWPAGLGDMEELASARGLSLSRIPTPSQFAWSVDGKQDSAVAQKVSGDNTIDAPYEYAAITDLYFAAAFLPDIPNARPW